MTTEYYIFSSLPFAVCLTWLIILLLNIRHSDLRKKQLTMFAAVCTVLYFCHAIFFISGGSKGTDAIWRTCSLSVYPLFWLYIRSMTEPAPIRLRAYWVVLPAIILGVSSVFVNVFPIDKAVFFAEVIAVCVFGYLRLKSYNRTIDNFYSDIQGKSMTPMMRLIWLLVATSACSALLNSFGREFFSNSLILIVPSAAFSVLLSCIFYYGSGLQYTATEVNEDTPVHESLAQCPAQSSGEDDDLLMRKIYHEMETKHLFKAKSLKITDLSSLLGSNKTYVSNSINSCTGKSFTEYVNGLRIEYAKSLIEDNGRNLTMSEISDEAGFSNETSFYRNFKRITGKTPSGWSKENPAGPQ